MPPYKDKSGRWRWRLQHEGRKYSGSTAKLQNTRAAALVLERTKLDKLKSRQFTGDMPTVAQLADQRTVGTIGVGEIGRDILG